MPSQATAPPLTVTVLAALWLSLGRCGVSESPGPGCDNGKLSLDRDLPADSVYWNCAMSTWAESAERLPSVDTVYDPEPARQTCMDTPISYNHTIPNSGAYRPVRAEGGEYLYCPPQRWLSNVHHGATVLLYHPCAPLHQRHLLSGLARSCLSDFIITAHPQLKHTPLALVSWGRTLELSSVASSDICDWLEASHTTRNTFDGVTQTRKYNLLLTWSARLQEQEQPTKMKESLRECCERTISSLPSGGTEAEREPSPKKERSKQIKGGGKSRQIRAAVQKKQKNNNVKRNTTTNVSGVSISQTNRIIPQRTRDVQNYSSTLGPSAGKRTRSTPQSKIQNQNQGHTPRPTAALELNMSETTLRTESLGSGASQSKKGRLPQTAALQHSAKQTDPSAGIDVLTDGVSSKQNHTARPGDSGKHGTKVNGSKEKNFDKDHRADGEMKDNKVVDVKEREVEHKQTDSATYPHHKNNGFDSVSKSQSDPQLQQHPQPQPASHSLPSSHECDGCKAGEHCDCTEASGAQARAPVVMKGLPRTPRTDEAVWAAAALGFLLILLTLSVLHTRLYRHWRTTPSLYWHDPRQDYDSVADVIRRRLRIAKRRRKRSRRQECVLLPSSSSSDEHP